jgi:hypothetical protein
MRRPDAKTRRCAWFALCGRMACKYVNTRYGLKPMCDQCSPLYGRHERDAHRQNAEAV